MENLDNLGYSTYVLETIKSVIECKKILVYNRNSFIGSSNYSRLNLYNLDEIFFKLLYNESTQTYNENCLLIERDYSNEPFEYDCNNLVTPGFNMIIYIGDNNPIGYTEFINTQGFVSNYIRVYLKFNIETNQISLELNNSLYRIKNRLSKNFIGKSLNKFPSSKEVVYNIDKLPKDQKYTSHLSTFLKNNNTSNIFLYDRTILSDGSMIKLDLIKDINIFDGESYSNHQIGYYQNDIVLYSWIYIEDQVGYYYRITSLLTQEDYKYTRFDGTEYKDTIKKHDSEELSKELLYCAGKYLVFKINYKTYSIISLFDMSYDNWITLGEGNLVVDPFDKQTKIYEFPKPTTIQSFSTILELVPEISDVFLDVEKYIKNNRSIDIVQKVGKWFIIKDSELYLFTCPSISVYMTYDEYRNSIIINNNTVLLKEDDYYILYHGPRKRTYYTEKSRSVLKNVPLKNINFSGKSIKICNDHELEIYLDYYKKSEISIVFKDSPLYNSALNMYRRQPLYNFNVPTNIIGAFGSIIFYINQHNNINYI